jgi:hypothetical protein
MTNPVVHRKLSPLFLSAMLLTGCGGSSSNVGPTVDAGTNQSVIELQNVSLLGTASDIDGSIATYQWAQTSGASVELTSAGSAVASFVAPDIILDETLTFQLTVTDNDGDTASASVDVAVVHINEVAIANAGADQSVVEQTQVTLAGVGTDIDGEVVSFAWQ